MPIIIFLLTVASSSFALKSHIPSTVEGVCIPNTHVVRGSEGQVLRSMRPISDRDYKQIQEIGVKGVLIFRTGDVEKDEQEMARLNSMGIESKKIFFGWRNLEFKPACKQTIEALQWLKDQEAKGQKALFHCTVGEDRTGYLAGIYHLLKAPESLPKVFRSTMCPGGYGRSSLYKPELVVETIRKSITPQFVKMAALIEQGLLSWDNLDDSVCSIKDPIPAKPKKHRAYYKASSYTCEWRGFDDRQAPLPECQF